ncbi:MAG: spermidine synthase [Candidatus Sericytochromatia bacterium]
MTQAAEAPGPSAKGPGAAAARWGVLGLMACSGAAAMIFEVVWTRLLSMVFGASTYAFSILLATFLAGLALGSLALHRLADRQPARAALMMAQMLALAGMLSLLTLSLINLLPLAFSSLYTQIKPLQAGGISPYLLALACKALLAAVVIFPASFCFGALFPLATRLSAEVFGQPDQAVSRVYIFNTLGAVAGSVFAGFALGPLLGLYRGAQLTSLGLLLLGSILLIVRARARSRLLALLPIWGLAIWLCLIQGNYDPRLLFMEIYQEPELLRDMGREAIEQHYLGKMQIVYYRDGITSSVAVSHQGKTYMLLTDGKVDSSSRGELATRKALAQLPLLLAPERRRVMVIGLGGGATASSALSHPLQELKVVEIEPAVVEAYQLFFKPFFPGVDSDPRVKIVTDDARAVVRRTAAYDIVISQSSHPWRTGSARLFTREFWQDCRQAMRPNGVFAQWLQLYKLSPDVFRTMVATFQSVFPHVLLFRFNQDAILLGSAEPLALDLGRYLGRMAEPKVQAELAGIKDPDLFGFTPGDLMVHLEAGETELAELAADAGMNTEDHPVLEFAAPMMMLDDQFPEIKELLERHPPPLAAALNFDGLSPARRRVFIDQMLAAVAKYHRQERPGLVDQLQALRDKL